MATQRIPHSLNYFQQSPVRGQLEPDDGYSRTGWRYLQCTDTPNELRVLLPPRTSLIYSQLLRSETSELAKDKGANWDRILQIRHLKDRMIRKCQRLARASQPADKNAARVMFFTLHAPPDFRLKEMERWFRIQGSDFPEIPTQPPRPSQPSTSSAKTPYCCSKCGPLNNPPQQTSSHRRAPSTSSRPAQPSAKPSSQLHRSTSERVPRRTSLPPSFPTTDIATKSAPISYKHRQPKPAPPTATPVPHRSSPPSARATAVPRQPKPVPSPPRSRPPPHQPHQSHVHPQIPPPQPQPQVPLPQASRDRSPPLEARVEVQIQPSRVLTQSPEPLPIPYRSSPEQNPKEEVEPDLPNPHGSSSPPLSYVEPDVLPPAPVAFPVPVPAPAPVQVEPLPPRESSPQSTLVDLPSASVPFPSSCPPLETIHERPEGSEDAPRPQLVRRRSSLKNGNGHGGNGNGRASRLSIVSQTKSVTWAMDREWVEQMAKYENATREAEVICQELDDARAEYRVCVAEMREICRNIAIASEKIRLETPVLHREETAVRDQELKLIHTSELVESKESLYREKVLAVLEETKRVVQLCDKKRDHRDD